MKKKSLVEIIQNTGLTDKAAKAYLSCLELGEATVQDIARAAKVKRTSLYYVLDELMSAGALIRTIRNKKTYYVAAEPRRLLMNAKERLWEAEQSMEELEERKLGRLKKPRIYFLQGPAGFKQVWDMIFATGEKEYRILTEGVNFLDFVKEKYILTEIIKKKKETGMVSKQLIVDSEYAREIVAKDADEGRRSKILPVGTVLPFTEIITKCFVAFISPRWNDVLFIIENEQFASTRREVFEYMWTKTQ